jgi:hypothetical protein
MGRLLKLLTFGYFARKLARTPAVATPARSLFRRFARRREAGRWHHVDPPDGPAG